MTWRDTPFETIEQAHGMAEKMQLYPTAIVDTGAFKSFQFREGRKVMLLGQATSGGSVRERLLSKKERKPSPQDPNAPTWSDADRLLVGPWVRSEHETYCDVKDHICKQYVNPDNLEFYELLMFREGEDEYQYYLDSSGEMYCRVLTRKK